MQTSVGVQASPSSHGVPSRFGPNEHVPVAGLQALTSWQASGGVHASGPPWQTPATQVSPLVQASSSSQGAPSGFRGEEHAPVAGSQVPAWWQVSTAAQITG